MLFIRQTSRRFDSLFLNLIRRRSNPLGTDLSGLCRWIMRALDMKYRLIEIEKVDGSDRRMVVGEVSRVGFPWARRDKLKRSFTVQGRCTVWHYYPSGVRCGSFLEAALSDLERGAEFRGEV